MHPGKFLRDLSGLLAGTAAIITLYQLPGMQKPINHIHAICLQSQIFPAVLLDAGEISTLQPARGKLD